MLWFYCQYLQTNLWQRNWDCLKSFSVFFCLQKCVFCRFINTHSENINITVGKEEFYAPANYGISHNISVPRGEWVFQSYSTSVSLSNVYNFKQPFQLVTVFHFCIYSSCRYNKVVCVTDFNQYEIDLGLLDFGAFYTVILTQVSDRVLVNVFLQLLLYCKV